MQECETARSVVVVVVWFIAMNGRSLGIYTQFQSS